MALLCLREWPDGMVCREPVRVLDSGIERDKNGKARQKRLVECPNCGPRLQVTYDYGPTKKRYVTDRDYVRPPLTPEQRAKEVKRVQDYRKRKRQGKKVLGRNTPQS